MEGNQFVRVLEGGEITHEVSAEGWNATACMLGGSDGASLFVLSTEPGSQEERMQGKASGRVSLVSAPSAAAGWPSSD
jgi:sugar lactone lactonase YvrE